MKNKIVITRPQGTTVLKDAEVMISTLAAKSFADYITVEIKEDKIELSSDTVSVDILKKVEKEVIGAINRLVDAHKEQSAQDLRAAAFTFADGVVAILKELHETKSTTTTDTKYNFKYEVPIENLSPLTAAKLAEEGKEASTAYVSIFNDAFEPIGYKFKYSSKKKAIVIKSPNEIINPSLMMEVLDESVYDTVNGIEKIITIVKLESFSSLLQQRKEQ